MTVEEMVTTAKNIAEKADSEMLINFFEEAIIGRENAPSGFYKIAYAMYEAYREELLRRLGK